jgi:signal transduction histidine kinase
LRTNQFRATADSPRLCRNPYAKKLKAGSEYLQPRNSFKKWEETIAGTSAEWTLDQRRSSVFLTSPMLTLASVDTASVLSTVYSKMIENSREKDTVSENSQIATIRNSTHELETPLEILINSLELAAEHLDDDRIRELLKHAYEASNVLINKVDNLLKLTETDKDAQNSISDQSGETFDLKVTGKHIFDQTRAEG